MNLPSINNIIRFSDIVRICGVTSTERVIEIASEKFEFFDLFCKNIFTVL